MRTNWPAQWVTRPAGAQISFRLTKPRQWTGKGTGFSPAQYEIRFNGQHAGTLIGTGTRWHANLIDGTRIAHILQRDARADTIRHLRRMNDSH